MGHTLFKNGTHTADQDASGCSFFRVLQDSGETVGNFPQGFANFLELPACSLLQNSLMTIARKHLIDRENGGYHHIVTRCVRRAWICGVDPLTKRDFSHRKGWIEARMLSLSDAFAIKVYGYAVMSNHYHIALKVEPKRVAEYSDEEVARRWLIAYPPKTASQKDCKIAAILEDPERIKVLRQRLGDLSWYMKCLNNHIARKANIEDDCTGKFWESRFHSSRPMKSLEALYACMAYIDLNPLSAGAADGPAEKGDHTSLGHRMKEARQNEEKMTSGMSPMGICPDTGRIRSNLSEALPLTLENYLSHIEWLAKCSKSKSKRVPAYQTTAPASIEDPNLYMQAFVKFLRRWGRKQGRGDEPLHV